MNSYDAAPYVHDLILYSYESLIQELGIELQERQTREGETPLGPREFLHSALRVAEEYLARHEYMFRQYVCSAWKQLDRADVGDIASLALALLPAVARSIGV